MVRITRKNCKDGRDNNGTNVPCLGSAHPKSPRIRPRAEAQKQSTSQRSLDRYRPMINEPLLLRALVLGSLL